jgi:hypothetical protein
MQPGLVGGGTVNVRSGSETQSEMEQNFMVLLQL